MIFREFYLSNERRQGCRIADADADQDDPEKEQRDARSRGITQPTSVRSAIAEGVASPIAKAAGCAPRAGTSSEKRCVIKPIC